MYMRYQWGYAIGHMYTRSSRLLSSLSPVEFLATHLPAPPNNVPTACPVMPNNELLDNVSGRHGRLAFRMVKNRRTRGPLPSRTQGVNLVPPSFHLSWWN
jgi:hypothetical protein